MIGPACDTHMHFYDGRYDVSPDATLFPPDALTDDYRRLQSDLGLRRVVVVQPTTYGLDNSCQLDAMADFGDSARGVMVVNAHTPASELARLTDLGVVGARFHMLPGGAVPWNHLESVATAIAPFGWHIQLQCNGHELAGRVEQLIALPVPLVVDHVGRFMPPGPPDGKSFASLVQLIESGSTWVKLSAPYESSQQPIDNVAGANNHTDVLPLIDSLVGQFPDRLLWASNWPHPGQDPAPTGATLRAQLERWLPDAESRRQVLVTNPDVLYFAT